MGILGEEHLSSREGTTSEVERGMFTRSTKAGSMENDLGLENSKCNKNVFMKGLQQNSPHKKQLEKAEGASE
jgi:hypothetical protein